jgi:predicted transcriptional regulator of viral defense system
METRTLLKKLRLEGRDFLTSDTLKGYCESLGLNYSSTVKYFISRGYLVRIFRGIFYLRGLEELELGRTRYSHLDLVAKGLELKGVKNWYFGLYTALKLNNMTHEHFTTDYVANDRIFRARPMEIAGYRFRFLKLKPALFGFGIIGDTLRYSDPEKTVLDLIYLWRYSGVPEEKIKMDIAEYAEGLSGEKMRGYARNYSKAVSRTVEEVVG